MTSLTVPGNLPENEAELAALLDEQLTALHQSGAAAFREVGQARTVVQAALRDLPPAYRHHHRDWSGSWWVAGAACFMALGILHQSSDCGRGDGDFALANSGKPK